MSKHDCAGIKVVGQAVVACGCLSAEMLGKVMAYARQEIISEIQAFANDYHHHVEGRDVVIVEQLLAFLTPVEGKVENGLGTT
jgi:hypothetical protein